MHCFMCDGDNVLAFRAFVIRNVFVSIDSTNNSNVRGIYSVKDSLLISFCYSEKKEKLINKNDVQNVHAISNQNIPSILKL